MPKILPITTVPSPILREKSAKISDKELGGSDFKFFCQDLIKTMKEKDGIGLAAPQVGENIRIIAVDTKNGPICMINPEIIKKSIRKEWDEEGCLSVPGVYGKVKRHKKIICRFTNKKGGQEKITANGLFARVIQHEVDHLDGILFTDKAKNIQEVEEL